MFEEIVQLDLATLDLLRVKLPSLIKDDSLVKLISDVEIYYRELRKNVLSKKNKIKINYDREISIIESKVNVKCEANKKITVYFGGAILNEEEISYYFIFADNNEPKNIAKKKIHFDIIRKKNGSPKFHLQLPGLLTDELKKEICEETFHSTLFPKISQPRIPFYPITIGILINQIFLEFEFEEKFKILEDPRWKYHIKKCEEFLNKYYFKKVADKCFGADSTPLFSEWYYEA